MTTVKHPEALAFKHNNAEGIRTRDGELTEWPQSLGPFPTQAQVNQWEAEWLAFISDPVNSATTLDDIVRALQTKGVLTPTDIADSKRNRQ